MPTGDCQIPKIGHGDAHEANSEDVGNEPCQYDQADDDGNDPEASLWEYSMVKEKYRKFNGRSTDHKDKGCREV